MGDSTLRVGAHVSIADGLDAAVDQQADYGGTCGQLFVGSPRTWSVSTREPEEVTAFKQATAEADIGPWIIHGTYLINFATPKDDLAAKSLNTVQAELDAAAELGIDYYTFHPGSHTGAGVDAGIDNVGTRLRELDVPDSVTVLLENTAGGGTSLGASMAELGRMLDVAELPSETLGVCLDTCHLYAAGYDFTTEAGMAELRDEIDAEIGRERVKYLHLNDSKHPRGSHKDEHAHIGLGEIGDAGFEQLLAGKWLRSLPMALETPVEDGKDYAWNIKRIRELADD